MKIAELFTFSLKIIIAFLTEYNRDMLPRMIRRIKHKNRPNVK